MEELKIKVKSSMLRKMSVESLLKVKRKIELHLSKARVLKDTNKGFSITEEKKNIARINTILQAKGI